MIGSLDHPRKILCRDADTGMKTVASGSVKER
jgi:hypothetical protein